MVFRIVPVSLVRFAAFGEKVTHPSFLAATACSINLNMQANTALIRKFASRMAVSAGVAAAATPLHAALHFRHEVWPPTCVTIRGEEKNHNTDEQSHALYALIFKHNVLYEHNTPHAPCTARAPWRALRSARPSSNGVGKLSSNEQRGFRNMCVWQLPVRPSFSLCARADATTEQGQWCASIPTTVAQNSKAAIANRFDGRARVNCRAHLHTCIRRQGRNINFLLRF